MIQITPHMRILVAHEPVDFRKGIDGLVAICSEDLTQDPFTGTAFVFRNRPQTGIKVLIYDGQGFWLCHKRLSKGKFKFWPTDNSKLKELESFRFQILTMAGNPNQLELIEPWRRIEPAGGSVSLEAGVPSLPATIQNYGSSKIQRPDGHTEGCHLHPKLNRPIPGIEPP